MSLTILNKANVFYMSGSLNSQTADEFKNHLLFHLNKETEFTIDIDNVNEIDSYGLKIISELYNEARAAAIKFFITGVGCREVMEELKY